MRDPHREPRGRGRHGRDAAGDQPAGAADPGIRPARRPRLRRNGARAPPDARPDRRRGRASARRAVGRQAQARCARRMPRAGAGPAAPRRARDAPRRRPSERARTAGRRVPRRGRHGVARPLPARRVGHRDRRARPGRHPDVARQLLRLPGGPRARAPAAGCRVRRAAEGNRAPRGGDPALQAVGEHGRRPPPHDPGSKHPAPDRADGQGRPARARAAPDRAGAAERRARRQARRRAA